MTKVATYSFIFVREIYMAGVLEKSRTLSFFVREFYMAFNEVKLKKIIGGFYYENKTWFNFCMDEKWSMD